MGDKNIEEKLTFEEIKDQRRTDKIVKWGEIVVPVAAITGYLVYRFLSKVSENHPELYEICKDFYNNILDYLI